MSHSPIDAFQNERTVSPSHQLHHSASKSALNASGSRADEMTRYTASDSFACKYSVYEAKYPALSKTHSSFVTIMKMRLERTGKKFGKRSPIMHRGYYARMEGQQMAIDRFLSQTESSHETRQILYLGCGFDTAPVATYAHYKSDEASVNSNHHDLKKLKIFEVDFPDIINQKYEIYSTENKIVKALATGETKLDNELKHASGELHRGASSKLASDTIKEGDEDEEENENMDDEKHADSKPILHHVEEKLHKLFSDTIGSFGHSHTNGDEHHGGLFQTVRHLGALTLISQDLRDAEGLVSVLNHAGFDPHKPTLIITECVLVYLNKEETDLLCSTLSRYFSHGKAVWVTYDMISPNDTYGQMMLKNLHKAGFALPGFIEFPTLTSHEEKFRGHGTHDHLSWTIVKSVDMLNFYNRVIDGKLIEEVNRLEILDEIEEWNMIMSHYCITVATNTENFHNIVDDLTTLRPMVPSPMKINPHALHR